MMRQPSLIQSKLVRLVFLGVIALVLLWMFGLRPAQTRLVEAAETRTELIKTALANSEKKRLLTEAESKYSTLTSDLNRLNGVIPEASDTGSFVSALEELAGRSGLQILSLTTKVQPKAIPNAATANANAKKSSTAVSTKTVEQELLQSFYGTTVEVRFRSGYLALRAFVQQIRQMERFVSIASINMSKDTKTAGDADVLTGTISMSIFHRQAAKDDSPTP